MKSERVLMAVAGAAQRSQQRAECEKQDESGSEQQEVDEGHGIEGRGYGVKVMRVEDGGSGSGRTGLID